MGNVMLMKSRDILTLDELKSHMRNTENPHNVTPDQIAGLNNIPIVTATSADGIDYTASDDSIGEEKVGMAVFIIPSRTSASPSPTFNLNLFGKKSIRRKISSGTASTSNSPVTTLLYSGQPTLLMDIGNYWIAVENTKPVANDLYGFVPIANGGTGAETAKQALDNLGAMPKAVPLTTAEYEAMESHDAGTMYMLTDDDNEITRAEFEAVVARPVNNNLLINSNFANPVNQRNETYFTGVHTSEYFIDRWTIKSTNTSSYVKINNYANIEIFDATISQQIKDIDMYYGKTITVSVKINGEMFNWTFTLTKGIITQEHSIPETGCVLQIFCGSSGIRFDIAAGANPAFLEWAKIEIGEHATPYIALDRIKEKLISERYYIELNAMSISNISLFNKDTIKFVLKYPKMHIPPHIDISGVKIATNESLLDGFTYTVESVSYDYAWIKANKPNHGLTQTNGAITLKGKLFLDAEM